MCGFECVHVHCERPPGRGCVGEGGSRSSHRSARAELCRTPVEWWWASVSSVSRSGKVCWVQRRRSGGMLMRAYVLRASMCMYVCVCARVWHL